MVIDRGKLGWKWSLATDTNGIPIPWAPEAANRYDSRLLEETLSILDVCEYEVELERLHLDRGSHSFPFVRELLSESGIEAVIPLRRKPKARGRRTKMTMSLGERWPVERANSWLTNFGSLEGTMTTSWFIETLAVALILTIKLVRWHKRYGAVVAASDAYWSARPLNLIRPMNVEHLLISLGVLRHSNVRHTLVFCGLLGWWANHHRS